MQEQSPPRQGLQSQKSFGKRCKELVIDCISPNTKQVRLATRGSASSSPGPTARALFSDRSATPRSFSQQPPSPDSAGRDAWSTPASQSEPLGR